MFRRGRTEGRNALVIVDLATSERKSPRRRFAAARALPAPRRARPQRNRPHLRRSRVPAHQAQGFAQVDSKERAKRGSIDPVFRGAFSETVTMISSNFVIHEHARPGVTGAPASGPLARRRPRRTRSPSRDSLRPVRNRHFALVATGLREHRDTGLLLAKGICQTGPLVSCAGDTRPRSFTKGPI